MREMLRATRGTTESWRKNPKLPRPKPRKIIRLVLKTTDQNLTVDAMFIRLFCAGSALLFC